jgi:hypothetical protein
MKYYFEYWFVSIALVILIATMSYGSACAGYSTGPNLFSWFRSRKEGFSPKSSESSLTSRVSELAGAGVAEPEKRDPMGKATSSKECVGKSSGLTSSSGGLCLPKDVETLLRTRGGNATFGA